MMMSHGVHVTISSLVCRFFIDRTPGGGGDMFGSPCGVTEEDQARISQRAHRFSQGLDGNRKFKPKLALDDLIKSAVRTCVNYVMVWVCDGVIM